METREARIKIVLDASAAKAAATSASAADGFSASATFADPTPAAADVPGLPDAAASSAAIPTAKPVPTPAAQAAFPPPPSPSGASAAAGPSAPGSPPPPYTTSTRVDLQPTAESESGNSASRPGTTAWGTNAARGIRNVGTAAIGGGSLSSALAPLPAIVPGVGTIAAGTLQATMKAAEVAERYGPFVAGALRGAARESGNATAAAFANDMLSALETGLDTVGGITSNIDAIGAGVEGVARIATGQGVLSRGRTLTAEQREAQARSLGIAFEAQRRISAREAQRQRQTRRIGLIYAGDQLASMAVREDMAPFLEALRQSLTTGSHR